MRFAIVAVCLMALIALGVYCLPTAWNWWEGELGVNVPYEDREIRGSARILIDGVMVASVEPRLSYDDRPWVVHHFSFALRRGNHRVQVLLDGYETWDETVRILGVGGPQEIWAQLKKKSGG
jgi:hypothetical protein